MNLKNLIIGILFLTTFKSIGQNQLLVVVDGFFTHKDSSFVVNYLDDEIKCMQVISRDSLKETLGEYAREGVLLIDTKNRNDEYKNGFDLNSLDPTTIEKIEIIHPYNAIMEYGLEMKSGIINIYTKE